MFSKPLARFAAFSILPALSISVFGVSAAWAEAEAEAGKFTTITFTLVNRTSRDLEAFYVSPRNGSGEWGEDVLGQDILFPGQSVKVTIDDDHSECWYDIKGSLGPGRNVGRGDLIQTNVNICERTVYEYSGK